MPFRDRRWQSVPHEEQIPVMRSVGDGAVASRSDGRAVGVADVHRTVDWGSAAASWPPPLVGALVALWDGIHCKSFTVKRSFDRAWQAGKGGLG